MDAATLDGLLGELRPRLLGHYLGRVRAVAAHALTIEVGRERLWCDAGRDTAGVYLLSRDAARALGEEDTAAGRTRQTVLLARKHLEGVRVTGLRRVPGTRTVILQAGVQALALRLGGAAPALTLALEGQAAASMGEGPPAWPAPEPEPGREWDCMEPQRFAAQVDEAQARGWSDVRAHVSACPALGPALARLLATGALGFEELQRRLRAAAPTLVAPATPQEMDDAALSQRDAVRLLPLAPPDAAARVLHPPTWVAAAALFLAARVRGRRFATVQRRRLEEARHRLQRLEQLHARLRQDRAGLPGAAELRRGGEALLAAAGAASAIGDHVEVPDPYQPERRLRVAVDPRLSLPVNADRLFAKARRVDRAAHHLEQRIAQAERDITRAREDEAGAQAARNLSDLEPVPAPPAGRAAREAPGPRRYLTSRGLEVVAGRGARENQEVTFDVAAPDDWWLHARDVPGAHVVLRDPEGRASDDDRREAAEVAAFFSEARAESQVDVHVTRRKHVRPAGGAGRVRVGHSDTLRVKPRDPEGRLRRR